LIQNEILKSGYQEMLGAGVVLTGGGSLLEGVVELGEFIFDVPVRRGVAMQVMGLTEVVRTPIMSTAVGLTKYGTEREYVKRGANENFMGKLRRRVTDLFDGML
jgi:cell division protein FtsA